MQTSHRKDPDRPTWGSNPGPSCCEVTVLPTEPTCRPYIDTVPALRCTQSSPSASLPSSVHLVRPADVSVLSALGLSDSYRSADVRILNGLLAILSGFNPDVSMVLPEPRDLLEEAENLAVALNNNQWKLILLFVPVDELCRCTDQMALTVNSTVHRVKTALDKLHEKLDRVLVHVVVWGGRTDSDSNSRRCECQYEDAVSSRVRTWYRAAFTAALLESLGALLQRHHCWNDREDFTVVLQSTPTHFDSSDDPEEGATASDPQTILQLWMKLLQSEETSAAPVPCPSEEKPYLYTQCKSFLNPQNNEAESQLSPMTGTSFLCNETSPSPSAPTSVHALRPADVKVVAALGDSITAGNGVGASQNNLLGVLTEYRGLSWSVGGDGSLSSVTTLANILREFNPSLTGYSTGTGKANTKQAFLNQAVAGSESKDLPPQARTLITRMSNDSSIDFHNDWKVVTLFIGGNDLCEFCDDTEFYSASNFSSRIRDTLDILHREVPRALVNVVELFDIVILRQLHQTSGLGCPTWLVKSLCPCVINPAEGSPELEQLIQINRAYRNATRSLVDSGRYNTRPDFTVLRQPFFTNVSFPVLPNGKPDRSYFAADCFHLSQKSHSLMAKALWNNMIEPVNSKTTSVDFNEGVSMKCPTASSPYLFTYENSVPATATPPIPNWGSDFSCVHTSPSDTIPASVHRLRPGDINVVAALGDSITAGFGAKAENLLELPNEERGVSWSIGGDETLETVTTIPNILKNFNPHVFGFSKGRGKRPNGFNMAVSGAKARDIPGQVRDLVKELKNSTNVDFEKDWKLVTLFIGGNDLCQYCEDQTSLSPKKYIGHIRDALDILYHEVPRVLVNFVEILQIEDLRKIKSNMTGCALLQSNICPCFLRPEENSEELSQMKRVNREIQTETERLAFGGRYGGREDFAVVLQPFFQNTAVPMGADRQPDLSFFSVDCFHFTERSHAEMGIALWNNMLEPVGSKQTYNNFTHDRSRMSCPSEDRPFIFTLANSFNIEPTKTTQPPPPTTTSHPPAAPRGSVEFWAAALLAIAGTVVGATVTWLILSCRHERKKNEKLRLVMIQGYEQKL
ncbi:phospholipase B1, membrane-associated isoform X2 [Trichomycterus rosablanca]